MTRALFDAAFQAARALHADHPALSDFTDWDDDATWADAEAHAMPCARRLASDTALDCSDALPARAPFTTVAHHAGWRETYTDDQIFDGFNARFGSFQLIGRGGHYSSDTLSTFILYSDRDLWYPWHDHPAEELYLIVAGEAEFFAEGRKAETLRPGDTCFHASRQPHAMRTHGHPILAYVLWRGDMSVTPTLTPPDRVPRQ